MKASKQMGRISWPLLLALGGLLLLSVGSAPLEPVNEEITAKVNELTGGNSLFAIELYSKIKQPDGNLIFSPFSISSALAIAYGGARGTTEKQIAKTLHFPTNQPSFHSRMGMILAALTNLATKGEVELHVANGLWPQRNYQFTKEFLALCRQDYSAEVHFADFATQWEAERKRINSWVGRQTKGRLNTLFPPGALTVKTRLVIANAVYFKGYWASRFDKRKTQAKPFWVSPEQNKKVPMMSQKSTFRHLADGDIQVLELPYRGGDISMLVLLPAGRDGLGRLEGQLTSENLNRWTSRLELANVDVLLPRFKISSRFSLSPTLAALGMPDAFDGLHADFTGMTAQRPLFINAVEHGAMVEVDEEGTVAAAATGVSFGCAKQPRPAAFHADHPFIFLIQDRPTGTMLFMGKVVDPSG